MVWEGARDRCPWLSELLGECTCGKSGGVRVSRCAGCWRRNCAVLERSAWVVGGQAGARADGLAAGALVVEIGLAVLSCARALGSCLFVRGDAKRKYH